MVKDNIFKKDMALSPLLQRKNIPENITLQNRIWVVFFVFTFCFVLLIIRLCELTVIKTGFYPAGEALYNKELPFSERAEIVDRNNILLATNVETASLYAHPEKILDIEAAFAQLKKIFPHLDSKTLIQQCKESKRFVWVKRNLTPLEQDAVNRLGLPGLFFNKENKRIYPHGHLASHVLGYVDVDGRGIAGIEKGMDHFLKIPQEKKEPLRLSIDINVQHIVRDVLLKYIATFRAKGGIGVVMDVRTGEVVAMVSLPDFDPHKPAQATNSDKYNQVTLSVFEVGSIMKPVTFAMGLDSGSIRLTDRYDVLSPLRSASYIIHDYHPSTEKWLSVPKIFINSSNIGTARIAMRMGSDIQKYFLELFGLLSPLPIELPEKSVPLVPKSWSEIHIITVAYGHGIAVTPMHMVQATSSLVNGGILYPATLLKHPSEHTIEGKHIISEDTSRKMRQLMRLSVEKGTGRKANVQGYMPGGKTGSAEKPEKGKYNKKSIMSSFIGAFPMHDPRYVILAMLDSPIGNVSTGNYATGGHTAAPIVRDIISLIGPLLQVPPVDESDAHLQDVFWSDYKKEEDDLATF